MRIKEITVSLGQTINLGNYESHRLDVSVTAELETGDDPALISADVREQAHRDLASLAKQEGVQLRQPRALKA